jgi:hypothetical protein
MAFSDLTLADADGTNQSFVVQQRFAGGVDFIESDATVDSTRKIAVRHSNAAPSVLKGARPARRHLAQFTQEDYNATLGKTEKTTLNVTLVVDPGASITEDELFHLRAFLVNFLTEANVSKLLRDEA